MSTGAQLGAAAHTRAARHLVRRRDFLKGGLALGAATLLAPRVQLGFAAPAVASPVEITFWHSFGQPLLGWLDELVADFNRSHENEIKVTSFAKPGSYHDFLAALLLAVRSGDAPDVIQTSTVVELARRGVLEPLDPLLVPGGVDLADFVPALLDDNRFQGQIFGFPSSRSTPLLYYNADQLHDADLDPTSFLSSWRNLKVDGHRLVVADGEKTTRFAYAAPSFAWFWIQLVWAFGGEISDASGAMFFDHGAAVEALQFWYDLVYTQRVAHAQELGSGFESWAKVEAAWRRRDLAVIALSSARLTSTLSQTDFTPGVAPMPAMRQRMVPHGGANLMLLQKSKEKEAGLRFMDWLTAPAQTARWYARSGYLPVRTSAVEQPEVQTALAASPAHKVVIDQLTVARATSPVVHLAKFEADVVNPMLETVLLGRAPDVQSALTDAAKKAEAIWAESLSAGP